MRLANAEDYDQGRDIVRAADPEVLITDGTDGKTFTTVRSIKPEVPSDSGGSLLGISASGEARYVRVRATPLKSIPNPQPGAK